MILNHHRLYRQQHHLHPILNLIELFQVTQQIGAFQLRVKQTLTQVLFTSFHRTGFWEYWGQWLVGVLQGWVQTPPEICLTPGLLPLQPGEVSWSWRETVAIQAMALEAAHQLVETLPLTSESLEMLLGLQDALVEDSSTIDPKGFEMVPLGLPLLPEDLGQVTIQAPPADPAIRHLPQVQVVLSAHAPQMISGPQILGRWLWEMTRQFGVEVGYLGLIFMARMAQAAPPWQGAIACEGKALLSYFAGESETLSAGLRTLIRRLDLLHHATICWQEQRLDQAQMSVQVDHLWIISPRQVCHALLLEGRHGEGGPYYQRADIEAVHFSMAPGAWCHRLLELYGEDASAPLMQLSQMAGQLLQLNPSQHRLAAQMGVFLVTQFWLGASPDWTVGSLLEAVESSDKIQALASNSMRRDSFFQEWHMMLFQFQQLGWQISDNPLMAWEDAPLNCLEWLDEPLSIHIHAHGISGPSGLGQTGLQPLPQASQASQPAAISMRRMDQISSRALEQALAARGMSQARLARSLKLDRSTINRWINGSRPIHPRYRPLLWELLGPDLHES